MTWPPDTEPDFDTVTIYALYDGGDHIGFHHTRDLTDAVEWVENLPPADAPAGAFALVVADAFGVWRHTRHLLSG
ncbi:hypothetical protein OS189_01230 [Sulfitobacter sp. F26169L]|uniref:hypothetical protein n=1 Tax=Sulfitobacter sp. F26169L TaxID=2996015 RepID=UPI002260A103|nr:hypothetical protein [Sulfitobacter sp. F26169L]MCX7564963.1 hypothetical protein [Sulfitobacter sp. F26169L]